MQVQIKINEEAPSLKFLVLDDEGFEAAGWVTMWIETWKDGQREEKIVEIGDIHLNDLMPALIAFDAKSSRLAEWDKQYLESHPMFTVDGKPLNTSL